MLPLDKMIAGNGAEIISDTDLHTDEYYAFSVIADAVFDTGTVCTAGTITSLTFSAGAQYFVNFTAIKLASGSIVAYKL